MQSRILPKRVTVDCRRQEIKNNGRGERSGSHNSTKRKTIKTMQRSSDQSKQGTGTDQKNGNQQRQKHLLEPVQNSGQAPLGVLCSSMESVHKKG